MEQPARTPAPTPAPTPAQPPGRPWWDPFVPRASARVQLVAAATVWLGAALMLLVRGVLFVEVPGPQFQANYWLLPIAAVAVTIGVVKARLVLADYAVGLVGRLETRGRSCFFGFFAPKSWAFIVVMMGGGILLRHSPLAGVGWGRVLLAVLYLAVATALLIADRILWAGALARDRAALVAAN